MIRRGNVLALVLGLGVLLAGCGDSTGSRTGSISLLLTDAPGDVLEAWVTIERIYLQPGEGEEDGQRVDLYTGDTPIDLITLADDIEELVKDAPVAAGFYEQLRVVVSGACIVVEGEEGSSNAVYETAGYGVCGEATGTLQAPSLSQTGIKVLLPGDGLLVTGEQQVLLLDFDVSESFGHAAGFSGQWVMEPVIKGSEIEVSSSITVQLSAAENVELPNNDDGEPVTLGDFKAHLSTEEVAAAFEDPDEDGVFTARFRYLVPDPADPAETPEVTIAAPDNVTGYTFTFDPASIPVDLIEGQDTEIVFVLTAVTQN